MSLASFFSKKVVVRAPVHIAGHKVITQEGSEVVNSKRNVVEAQKGKKKGSLMGEVNDKEGFRFDFGGDGDGTIGKGADDIARELLEEEEGIGADLVRNGSGTGAAGKKKKKNKKKKKKGKEEVEKGGEKTIIRIRWKD